MTAGCEYYFRVCFLDPFQGSVMAQYAFDEGFTKVATLEQLGDDYSAGLANFFKKQFIALGGEIVDEETFQTNQSDFKAALTQIKAAGAEAIFAPTSISYAQMIVDQAAAQGITMPLLAGDTWDSNVVLAATQGKDVSVYVTTFYAEGGDVAFETGFKDYINNDSTAKANNGGDDMIAAVSVMGYDAYYVALEALKAAGSTDPADVLAALPDVTYSGVSGEIAFNEIGDAIRDTAFVKQANTTDNVWDFVKVQSVAE